MAQTENSQYYKVIVIGAGQAGLSAGYFLSKLGVPFVILDANNRVGDQWRKRWNTLRLFTPAKFDGLAGFPFPASANSFPTKNEMADYLESYVQHFNLPIHGATKVDSVSREGSRYFVTAGEKKFEAEHVIVAMSNYQNPRIPEFANDLNPDIIQIHSLNYREPTQLQEGDVLVVGAGNSGCEIAIEAAKNNHRVFLSGRDVGHIPFHIDGVLAKVILARLVLRIVFHRILTIATPIGRKARPKMVSQGGPLIRIKPKEISDAGVERIPKIAGVRNGLPFTKVNQTLDVKNVVWCTGFNPAFSWINIPVFKNGEPMQRRGVVEKEPGLYFVGLHFLYSLSSGMVHGAARDSEFVVNTISKRLKNQ